MVSTRLDGDDGAGRVARCSNQPSLRFKLDPTDDWPPELITQLAALGVVDVIDMKGQYGDDVPFGHPAAPETYRASGPSPALIEDPRLTPDAPGDAEGHEDRVTWDAPIHSVDDILARDWAPRTVNMKPSRFLRELFATYDYIREHRMNAYAGGQREPAPGAAGAVPRLAVPPPVAERHRPRRVQPPSEPDGLPSTPLPVQAAPTGFRWGE